MIYISEILHTSKDYSYTDQSGGFLERSITHDDYYQPPYANVFNFRIYPYKHWFIILEVIQNIETMIFTPKISSIEIDLATFDENFSVLCVALSTPSAGVISTTLHASSPANVIIDHYNSDDHKSRAAITIRPSEATDVQNVSVTCHLHQEFASLNITSKWKYF